MPLLRFIALKFSRVCLKISYNIQQHWTKIWGHKNQILCVYLAFRAFDFSGFRFKVKDSKTDWETLHLSASVLEGIAHAQDTWPPCLRHGWHKCTHTTLWSRCVDFLRFLMLFSSFCKPIVTGLQQPIESDSNHQAIVRLLIHLMSQSPARLLIHLMS